jgi:enoyl-CoA hydratase
MALVKYELDDTSARITMDDGKVNVLSAQMLAELHEALDRASGEGVPVVLSGRERVFSAGFDLSLVRAGGDVAADMLTSGFTLAERLLSFPAPVVVACTGHAIAMGFFLVLSGDHRIGVSGPFKLTANEVALGLVMPRTPMEICRYRLLPGYFDRAVILAEVFSPDGAMAGGVLDRVVEAPELDDTVNALVETLATLDIPAHRSSKLRARAALLESIKESIVSDDVEFRASAHSGSTT